MITVNIVFKVEFNNNNSYYFFKYLINTDWIRNVHSSSERNQTSDAFHVSKNALTKLLSKNPISTQPDGWDTVLWADMCF